MLEPALAGAARLIRGGDTAPAAPARVRRRIEQQQQASEIIIGWMQALAVVVFATVYMLSPKAFPPETEFEPVPWTLAAYALFTAVRIYLAHRRRLAGWFVAASTIIDVAVLMITIWSFHLQYQAPPALYLKAPTLMYIFILIALRTLRFEPRYVVIAGATGAVGWAVLFVYAAAGWSGEPPSFTRSYTDYVTSYRILLGAEIDKILSIIMVTAILALSLARARRLLSDAVAEEIAAADMERFFAPEVAEQLRRTDAAPRAGQGVRRDAAILSVDLRGFTDLSHDLTPTELVALLGEYQTRLVPVIERHGGEVDKYVGDGILASFGAVEASSSYAADLCRAIEDLTATARHWQQEREARGQAAPAVGMAGAAGDVVFGTVGHETRLEYTVIGEVVNLAAKVEKSTKDERVPALVTRRAFELAVSQGYRPRLPVSERPGRKVKGVSEPVDLVALAGG